MRGPFVGRGPELAALVGLIARLGPRTGPVAGAVVGEPGAGKTRLLWEAGSRTGLAEQVWLRGYELEQVIPLATARALLQRLREVPGAGEALDSAAGADPSRGPLESVRLFESAHRALATLGPVLVLVDDVQWADAGSVALLHYVMRAAVSSRRPLAVVIAGRPAPTARTLSRSLLDLVGPAQFAEVTLGRLSDEDGARLALDLAPDLDAGRVAAICRRAGGSPFWLHLLAADDRTDADVDRVVRERLQEAGDDADAVAGLMAVAGRPLGTDDIAAVCRWPDDRVSRAVTALERVGVAGTARDRVAFTHDLVREAAERTLGEERARRLHGRWGRWLEQDAGADDLLLLEALEHQQAAGDAVDGLALRLARSPRRRLLGAAGLERLLSVAAASPRTPQADELAEALGTLASELGEHHQAFRIWSTRAALGRPGVDTARASLLACAAATALSRHSEARRYLDLAGLHAGGDPELVAEVLAQESVIQRYLEGDPDGSRATALRALAAARPPGWDGTSAPDRVSAPTRRAWLHAARAAMEGALTSDDPEQMLGLAEELAVVAAGVDDRIGAQAQVEAAMALRLLGRNADAEVRLQETWDLCRRLVLPESTIEVGTMLARVLVSRGRLTEARTILRDCEALGARVGTVTPVRAFGVTLPWLIELSAGSWRKAVDGLRAAAAAEPNPHFRLQAHVERATALSRLAADTSDADLRETVRAALDDADSAGCRRCRTETLLRSGQVLARVGDLDRAAELVAGAEVNAADEHTGFWARWVHATLLSARRDADAAGALEMAMRDSAGQGLALESLWVGLDLGHELVHRDRPHAVEVLADVSTAAERMGAVTEARVAGQLLRSLGVRAWRRGRRSTGPDVLDVLTAREREIARQVATGSSNPDIAAAMFLSRKTVEHHVSNVLGKLGLRNRAELAALVGDEDLDPVSGPGRTSPRRPDGPRR